MPLIKSRLFIQNSFPAGAKSKQASRQLAPAFSRLSYFWVLAGTIPMISLSINSLAFPGQLTSA